MSHIVAEPLSHVRPETIRWLWKPYLPLGKLAVLDGDPGVGKSFLTIDLAARLSRGGPLPDGTPPGGPHVTLLVGAEDDAGDTTRPRAEAAGADLDRLVVVTSRTHSPICFPADLTSLAELVVRHRPSLVVIDPITAFLPRDVASNSDQSVRRVLSQFALIAEKTHCAIVLVRHLRKAGGSKAVYRGAGSIGIIASARTGLLAACHPTDHDLRVLAVAKSNVAGPVPSLGYRVRDGVAGGAPVVEWAGPADVDANALGRLSEELRPRDRAAEWLRGELAGGPRRSSEVLAAAVAARIPERTLERAKADLRVGSVQTRRDGVKEWYWYDPSAPWPTDAPVRKPLPGELPPLDDL
jgi:hypothetical protein